MGTVPRQLRPTGHFAIRSSSSSSPSPAPSSAAMRAWMATPSVAVDEARLKANIDRMQQLASSHGVQLRPHAKTHKTREVASLQVAAGACGVAVSKPSEALKFLHAGIDGLKSVLLAFPVVQPTKLSKVVHASQQTGIELLVTVDSALGVDALEKAALSCDHQVKALLHIDVGYHRVGLEEDDPRILELAKRVHASKALQFGGLLSHAGHAYSCKSVEECAEVAEIERCIMVRIKKSLEENGVPVPIVSCGSTLTEPARQSFEGITEIRPGNYVFLDRTPVRMGLVTVKDVALSVVVTVVSSNKRYFIVDGGSKVFSSDGVRSGGDVGANTYGLAFYERDFDRVVGEPTVSGRGAPADDGTEVPCFPLVKLSEEHGWVKHVEGVESPPLGARLVVLPNHACVVANLTDTLYVQGQQPKSWKLISRGCTQ